MRRIEAASGLITTVAGNGNPGDDGDGGPATGATLHPASGLAADASGSLYIAQADSARIRRVQLDVSPAVVSPSTVSQLQLRYFRRRRASVQVSVYLPRPGAVQQLNAEIAYDQSLLASPRVTLMRIARGAVVVANDQVPGRLTIAATSAAPIRAGRVLTVQCATKGSTRPTAASVRLVKGTAVRMQ